MLNRYRCEVVNELGHFDCLTARPINIGVASKSNTRPVAHTTISMDPWKYPSQQLGAGKMDEAKAPDPERVPPQR